jgi:hypothetical protein
MLYNSSNLLFSPFIIDDFHPEYCMDKVHKDLMRKEVLGRRYFCGM